MLISDIIRQKINKKNVNLYNKYLSDIIDNSNTHKQIKINKIIPKILKNKVSTSKINKESSDTNKSNFILFNDKIYSNMEKNIHE